MSPVVIEVENLNKSFGAIQAVDDVTFDVKQGEIFGVLGPNGSGKTTTVECLTGLQTRDGGSVHVHGLDPVQDRDRLRRIVGIQLQESRLADRMTVREALRLFATFYAAPADPEEVMDTFGLRAKAHSPFKHLSGGQKQRLSIALALVGNPRVVVLDELTTGLDPAARRATWDVIAALRDRDVTTVLVTHFTDEAEYLCDRVAILQHGRLVALDTPDRLTINATTTRIRIITADAIDMDAVGRIPGVTNVQLQAGTVEITGTTPNLAFAVSAELAGQGIEPDTFEVKKSSLEDFMLQLEDSESEGHSNV